MNENSTIIFVTDNTQNEENQCIYLNELFKIEEIVDTALDKIEFSPGKKVVDRILDFARNS
ncbi:MAG: hypothetical protein U0W24_03895 [Bacteroidales bacterium]